MFLLFVSNIVRAQKATFKNRYVVDKKGNGDFLTIQDAVNAVRDLSQQRVTIFIKNGVYKEKIIVPQQKSNITLLGENKDSTIISNGDYSGKVRMEGRDAMGLTKFSTYTSYTVLVQGQNFIAKDLTIENTAGRIGQAVALHVDADRVQVINCRLSGNQDTLYAAEGRQYYQDCIIEGTTDFIFGKAIAIFSNCTIVSKQNSYITAASSDPEQKYGFVFFKCKLMASDNTVNQVFLGRPWRPFAKTVFLDCNMGGFIRPDGWDNWRDTTNEKTAFYAEYHSTGSGANLSKRVKWSYQLTSKEAKLYSINNIFNLNDTWIPSLKE
ncbi:pectinesterase family protein [Rhizosphaericola mali]|uniref:pectinesterase family protein n=1 Tax=Rhizosphaericola mali TaxID=2545455 RepID=UPI001CD981B0|nr:pectinesterase family protein [Rhizosphaericola mali]